jgi:hypothetical protein
MSNLPFRNRFVSKVHIVSRFQCYQSLQLVKLRLEIMIKSFKINSHRRRTLKTAKICKISQKWPILAFKKGISHRRGGYNRSGPLPIASSRWVLLRKIVYHLKINSHRKRGLIELCNFRVFPFFPKCPTLTPYNFWTAHWIWSILVAFSSSDIFQSSNVYLDTP